MSRTYYTDYVRHALRFYTRNSIKPRFKSDVDKANWVSCQSAFKKYSDKNVEILMSVYSGYDTLGDEVYNASKKYSIDQNKIWDMMKDIERKIAHRRGLI